jgi:hypothetical protein
MCKQLIVQRADLALGAYPMLVLLCLPHASTTSLSRHTLTLLVRIAIFARGGTENLLSA